MKIGISYSLKPIDPSTEGPDDRFEEFDRPETVDAIASVIRSEGHEVLLLGDGREFLTKVLAEKPDFVFNIAEGQGAGRNRESHVPAMCEMLGIAYSGSDSLTLGLALDKTLAKRMVQDEVMIPDGIEIPADADADDVLSLLEDAFATLDTAIVKPALEGSSKGIRGVALAANAVEAAEICNRLIRDYRQPILVEQFVDGEEVTVGILGNGNEAKVLGTMRVVPQRSTERFVYSLEVKRDWARQVRYETPAVVDELEPGVLELAALNAFHALACRDFARIDFRIKDGVPYFIEANPLPGLAPVTSDLVILAEGYGVSHSELIQRILQIALERVGLGPK